jgi:hypothetical protein
MRWRADACCLDGHRIGHHRHQIHQHLVRLRACIGGPKINRKDAANTTLAWKKLALPDLLPQLKFGLNL